MDSSSDNNETEIRRSKIIGNPMTDKQKLEWLKRKIDWDEKNWSKELLIPVNTEFSKDKSVERAFSVIDEQLSQMIDDVCYEYINLHIDDQEVDNWEDIGEGVYFRTGFFETDLKELLEAVEFLKEKVK